jgi:hypothetical protein
MCPVQFTHDLSALKGGGGCWRVETPQPYSAAETERMMKLQDVLVKAMAKKIRWWDAAEIIEVAGLALKPPSTLRSGGRGRTRTCDLLRVKQAL